MQYVNDNMDDLFRAAAENYPLDISRGANWNKVQQALQESNAGEAMNKRSGTWIVQLLTLLFFALLCNHFALEKSTKVPGSLAGKRSATQFKNQSGREEIIPLLSLNKNAQSITNEALHFIDKTTISKGKKNSIELNNLNVEKAERNVSLNEIESHLETENPLLQRITDDESRSVYNVIKQVNIPHAETAMELIRKQPKGRFYDLIDIKPTIEKQKLHISKGRFYIGLLGGADLTTVHLQKPGSMGYQAGGLIGYNINKRWSAEASVFVDKKFYFTEGKHFNTAKVYLPANSKITQVSGYCKMIEIPISIKYNLKTSSKAAWFVTGGASSYLMKKEDYDYLYYYGTTGTQAVHHKSYLHSSNNLFSVLQLTTGYRYQFTPSAALRIEPYLKIPLSGIGIGNMKLVSAGINIGFTKTLF